MRKAVLASILLVAAAALAWPRRTPGPPPGPPGPPAPPPPAIEIQNLTARTLEGKPITMRLQATGGEGRGFGFEIVAKPSHGELSGTEGARVYTPAACYAGEDSFAYRARSGSAQSGAATATITVVPRQRTVWAFGRGMGEDVNEGSRENRFAPVPVKPLAKVRDIVAGAPCWAVTLDGRVRSWDWPGREKDLRGYALSKLATLRDVDSVAAYGGWLLALNGNGTVCAWGRSAKGDLETGTFGDSRYGPVWVAGLPPVKQVATRLGHAHVLARDGSVWSWGRNDNGELGTGDLKSQARPARVAGLEDVVWIAAGDCTAYAVTGDGRCFAWGANQSGLLGVGSAEPQVRTPTRVGALRSIVAAASGGATLALDGDGTVWSWGANNEGQCGDGTTAGRATPAQVKGLDRIIAVAAGTEHCLALKKDGTVWAWGSNRYGQLGQPKTVERHVAPVQVNGLRSVTAIDAGPFQSLALSALVEADETPFDAGAETVPPEEARRRALKLAARLESTLARAAAEGNIESAYVLFNAEPERAPELANAADARGDTPLHMAASNGHAEMAGFLLDHGAAVNKEGSDGNTPLHLAAMGEHLPTVNLLLRKGANIGATNASGATPLHAAAVRNHKGVAVVQTLLAQGADPLAQDKKGRTPLDCAVRAGHNVALVALLKGQAQGPQPAGAAQAPAAPPVPHKEDF